jgi:hypothetical protein
MAESKRVPFSRWARRYIVKRREYIQKREREYYMTRNFTIVPFA